MASSQGSIPSTHNPKTYSREIVLLATLVLLLLAISFTAFATRMYHKKYHMLGDEWFAKGETSFQSGDAAAALNDYRNALIYNPANPNFQFHLAQALAGTGRDEEARAYLMNLLSESPGSGQINLELARIAARSGSKNMPEALRFYHAAIYGVWDTDPIAMRWRIRREFCEYLLNNQAMNQAEAEVIALADNTGPEDAAEQKVTGNLLLRAQMWNRALQQFQNMLTHDPRDQDALAGAGTAAFQLAQYSNAADYFDRLPRERRVQPDLVKTYEVSRDIGLSNPFLSGLSANERARRTAIAVETAQARASACVRQKGEISPGNQPKSPLEDALATANRMANDWTERNLRRFPDRIEPAMSSVFEIEDAASKQCGEPQGTDYALWLLGRSRGGNGR
ncbi:MAG: tetratricopeptide repeat protein [Candidatus Acidiferrales bacterium]